MNVVSLCKFIVGLSVLYITVWAGGAIKSGEEETHALIHVINHNIFGEQPLASAWFTN